MQDLMSEASLECLCLNIFDVFSAIICLSDLLGFVLMDVLFFFYIVYQMVQKIIKFLNLFSFI